MDPATFAPFHDLPAADLLAALGEKRPFVLLDTSRVSAGEDRSFLFMDPVEIVATADPQQVALCLERLEGARDRGLWAAGFLSYELGYLLEPSLELPPGGHFPLLWFGLFPPPFVFDHRAGTFSPPLPFTLRGKRTPPPFTVAPLGPSLSREEYARALHSIRDRLADGDTYQVNFTMKYRFGLSGSPAGLYLSLRDNQPVPYAAFIRTGELDILSASPELFIRQKGLELTVRPMKGTMARGRTPAEDARHYSRLAGDPKNRAENIMIVDLIRNDLGRLCSPGSVRVEELCRIEAYDTVLQMTSTVRGTLPGKTPLHSLLRALFPCGSVTGAPKIRTMQIIADLENEERGVFCGAIGFLSPQGEAVLSVPIRTAVIDGGQGEMGVGSGIVADSEADDEYEECLLKARFLTHPRPFLYLIETLRWQRSEGFHLLEEHLVRLSRSAAYFGFPCPVSRLRLELCRAVQGRCEDGPCRVRLSLFRDGRAEVSVDPLTPDPPGPLPVCLSPVPTNSADPHLYHKTSRRETYDRELNRARSKGFFEVLFTNERGELTEGAFTNLFVERGARLVTPALSCGLLDGVFRSLLLRERPGSVAEGVLRPADLAAADRLFVGNSVRGLIEVRLEERPTFSFPSPR